MAEEAALPGRSDEFCNGVTPLRSKGVWGRYDLKGLMYYDIPRLQLQLATIYILTESLHVLFKCIRLPRIAAEIMAGIILGPSLLGQLNQKLEITLFPPEGEVFLETLSRLGYILFMFLIGVKMEPGLVKKSGKLAWAVAITSVTVPLIIALNSSGYIDSATPIARKPIVRTVIAVQTMSPFPVVALLLMDLKITNTELGRLALTSALISDLASTAMSTFVSFARVGSVSTPTGRISIGILTQSFCFTGLIFMVIVFVVRPYFFVWLIKKTPEGKPVKGVYVTIIAAMVLFSAIISDSCGLPYHFGPFILGLCVPVGPPLGSTLVEKLDSITSGMLAPLMATYCGLKINLTEIYDITFQSLIYKICFASAFVKVSITICVSLIVQVPLKDAAALAVILNAQGIVEMASYLNYSINQTIDRETLATTTMSVLILSVITTVIEHFIYDFSKVYRGYQKRDIFHSTYNSELRILACVHRQDEALAAIKLLEVSNPTKESPIGVYAVNLVELLGRASPLIINHGLNQKGSLGSSRSQQTVETFTHFGHQNRGLMNVQVFTAISLPKFMHQDICSLAFDKMASLIILPFHRKWNQQGQLIYDSSVFRMINRQVLETAPCSVGILVDRRKLRQSSPVEPPLFYRVAVVFVSGNDDREALAYGKRMAYSSQVHLTVVRLTGLDDKSTDKWEFMLDCESLRDIKLHVSQQDNIVIRDENVQDGTETISIIRKMQDEYDLIMVGRRHKELPALSGLAEWSELPEIGVLGDMLCSTDISKPVSVLVVQQQLVQLN